MRYKLYYWTLLSVLFSNALFAEDGVSSRNGYLFPVKGEVRLFLVFAEMINLNNDQGALGDWQVGEMPPNPDRYASEVEQYFREASFGEYNLYSYYTRSLKREGEIVYFDSTIPKYPDVPDIRGLNELETSALQVYYDESLKKLSIHSEDADWTGTFSLYDLSGNRLYQTSVCSRVQVPLDSYSDGYYLCEIVCGNRVVYSSKIRL